MARGQQSIHYILNGAAVVNYTPLWFYSMIAVCMSLVSIVCLLVGLFVTNLHHMESFEPFQLVQLSQTLQNLADLCQLE